MKKNEKLSKESDFPPLFLTRNGEIIRLNLPKVISDRDGKYLAQLASVAIGYHNLLKMGWKKIEGEKLHV